MTDAASHAPANCENCATPLLGKYCHACGQSIHNPLRNFWHALEELVESFWHLDGRVFRTLRDLLVPPGLVANRYLRGHRVDYVAPLRLFVVMSLLAVVVGHFAMAANDHSDAVKFNGVPARSMDDVGAATTVAEAEQRRDRVLQHLREVRAGMTGAAANGREGVDAGIEAVNAPADRRIAELREAAASGKPVPPPSKIDLSESIDWDANKDPVRIGWLPDFANRWLTSELAQGKRNLSRIQQEPELFMRAFFGAMPKALFVLVPLFALLLKLAYIRSGRPYLEHLVVALYSHSWLLLIILLMCLLSIAGDWLAPRAAWAAATAEWFRGLLWLSMPVYLLLMQKRVYGQGWLKTLLKYLALGSVYFFLVAIAVVALAVYSVVHA